MEGGAESTTTQAPSGTATADAAASVNNANSEPVV